MNTWRIGMIGFVLLAAVARGAESAPVVTGATLSASPDAVALTVPSESPVRVFALREPHRLVVDVPAISGLPSAPALHAWPVGRWGITELRTSQFGSDPASPVTRFVLVLERPCVWRVTAVEGGSRVEWPANGLDAGEMVFGVLASIAEPSAATEPETAESHDPPIQGAAPVAAAAETSEKRAAAPRSAGEERIWNRRAAELVAEARVDLAAGAYREGLDRLSRVFSSYPVSTHTPSAHGLAARFACELHLGNEALRHLDAIVADPLSSDSVLVMAVETVATCPLEPAAVDALRGAYDGAKGRLGSASRETRLLGVRLGKLLAESGKDLDFALELLADGIKLYVDAADAAQVHRAVALCQERRGEFGNAAEQQEFAARLLTASDRSASLALRLRAADNLFRADRVDEALAHYEAVSNDETAPEELRSWAAFQCGNCYYRQRKLDLAMAAYEELQKDHPASFWSQQAEARVAVLREAPLAR